MRLRAHSVKIMDSHIEGQTQMLRQTQNRVGQTYKMMKVQALNTKPISECSARLQQAIVSDRNLQITFFAQQAESNTSVISRLEQPHGPIQLVTD